MTTFVRSANREREREASKPRAPSIVVQYPNPTNENARTTSPRYFGRCVVICHTRRVARRAQRRSNQL